MKILSKNQTRLLDEYTIAHEPILSIDLMERASQAFLRSFALLYNHTYKIIIFCGTGNNGGDGLAVARKLHQMGYDTLAYIVGKIENGSADFLINLERLNRQDSYSVLTDGNEIKWPKSSNVIIIDAIFGTGLNRPIEGLAAEVIKKINSVSFPVVSIDIASGLNCEKSVSEAIIKPSHTITFQYPKLAFFLPQNEEYIGNWEAVDIGLSQDFIKNEPTKYYYTTADDIIPLPRPSFSHKGTFGHAYLVAGSEGMMGAAVLATKACLRSGVGKITVHSPKSGKDILQISVPEAIVEPHKEELHLSKNWNFEKYDAIGIGPGLGLNDPVFFESILRNCQNKKLLVDADAITMLGNQPELIQLLPVDSILTPHPKEFRTLIGKTWENDNQKIELLADFSEKNKVIICLKGKNTAVALPDGSTHFNSTGNSGMATAGSGDVLTGIILGFLAQGYTAAQAAIQGVYEHGLAGDVSAKVRSERSMIASDLIENLR